MAKRKITAEGLLRLVNDLGETLFPMTRVQTWKNALYPKLIYLEDYFPSEIKKATEILLRKGQVEMKELDGAIIVKITAKGKREQLSFDLENMIPKIGKWDGKWRMVFFDVAELERRKRDKFRRFLMQLGMKKMQESVWVSPYDIEKEIKYVREILGIPDEVKIGIMEKIENEEDLKEWFEL